MEANISEVCNGKVSLCFEKIYPGFFKTRKHFFSRQYTNFKNVILGKTNLPKKVLTFQQFQIYDKAAYKTKYKYSKSLKYP